MAIITSPQDWSTLAQALSLTNPASMSDIFSQMGVSETPNNLLHANGWDTVWHNFVSVDSAYASNPNTGEWVVNFYLNNHSPYFNRSGTLYYQIFDAGDNLIDGSSIAYSRNAETAGYASTPTLYWDYAPSYAIVYFDGWSSWSNQVDIT
jgi:hypothetical protein